MRRKPSIRRRGRRRASRRERQRSVLNVFKNVVDSSSPRAYLVFEHVQGGYQMKIVIPGGSGHLGALLARAFYPQHEVVVLSRQRAMRPWRTVWWDGVN